MLLQRGTHASSLSHDVEVLPLTTLNTSWDQLSSVRLTSYAVLQILTRENQECMKILYKQTWENFKITQVDEIDCI